MARQLGWESGGVVGGCPGGVGGLPGLYGCGVVVLSLAGRWSRHATPERLINFSQEFSEVGAIRGGYRCGWWPYLCDLSTICVGTSTFAGWGDVENCGCWGSRIMGAHPALALVALKIG